MRKADRIEDWREGIEFLTIWFKKPLIENEYGFLVRTKAYTGLIRKKYVASYEKNARRLKLRPCLLESLKGFTGLSFPFPEEKFLALFRSNESAVCPSVVGSCVGVAFPNGVILRMRKSGKRMFRIKNGTCNWCGREGDRRAVIKMPEDTPPRMASFMSDGKPYGMAYWGCNSCLKKYAKKLNLHIFDD